MQESDESNMVTEDEMNLIHSLRQSVGGPYLAALNQEQKDAFVKLMETFRPVNGNTSSIH